MDQNDSRSAWVIGFALAALCGWVLGVMTGWLAAKW